MDKRKNDTESRESTVLSDPHKKEAPKTKPRGKIVLSVIAAVLVAFVLVPYGIVKITGAANKRSAAPAPFSSRLSATEAEQLANGLFAAKTHYIGDNSAVLNLIDILGVRAELGDYTISLKTDSEPYRLIINFKNAHDTSRDEWFDLTAIRYSCVLMALIDNAGEVAWTCPGSDKREATEGFFTREDAKKLLSDTPVERYGESAEGVQLLLNELGIGD